MANLNDFTEFADLFKKHIQEHNDMTIDSNMRVTKTDKIATAYQYVKTSMDNLLTQYINIGKQQKDLADTFIQVLTYMVYHASLAKSFEEYKMLAKFILALFDEDSELMKLLKLIEEKLIIYNALDKPEYHDKNFPPARTEAYLEWEQVKLELEELFRKLFELLKKLLVALGILPEGFEIEMEDTVNDDGTPGKPELKITKKGSRSFYKKFNLYDKHFHAYLGEVNRKGYVGQKAKVYMQMPLVRSGQQSVQATSGSKHLLNISSPLMDISNIDFINKSKNIIFGWFNIYDYVGQTLIENEDDEQKSAYIYKDSYVRFGGIFSGKDIDPNAGKQNFRLNYAGSGWTSGKIRKKGTFNIDNVSMTCMFGDKDYCEDPNQYPLATKLCDKIDFYEEISSLTDNTRYKLTGELSYDEEYSNQRNHEEQVLAQNLKEKESNGESAGYTAPTIDVIEVPTETRTPDPNYPDDRSKDTVTTIYNYYWSLNGDPVKKSDESYAEVPTYVKNIVSDKCGHPQAEEGYSKGRKYNTPKTGTYKSGDTNYYTIMYYGHKENDSDFTFTLIKTKVPTVFIPTEKSYFKGSLKLESLDEEEDDETSSSGFMSDYTSSKDVILELSPTGGDLSTGLLYDIKCSLDPDSQSNANYSEDNENDPAVFLPPIVSNFEYKDVLMTETININTAEQEVAAALLGLSQMNMDDFDELDYSSLIDKLNDAKSRMIGSLLDKIGNMNALITTIITAGSLFQAYDELYTSEYTEDITTGYSEIQNVFQTYLSTSTYDIAELYNGTFTAKVEKGITKIDGLFGETLDDIITSENIYHNYENKLSYLVNSPKLGLSFNSPLACAYDILSGNSTTIATMSASGQAVITYPIMYSYVDWLNLYMTIPMQKAESKNYFAETYLLQYLYIITQFYKFFSTGNETNIRKVNYFLRILLLRLLKDNIYNSYFSDVYRNDEKLKYNVKSILENYTDIENDIECENLDFNTYFLNPFIVDCFPEMEKFNRYNINDAEQLSVGNIEKNGKALLYKAILNLQSNKVHQILESMHEFLNNGQRLNVRELVFAFIFYNVVKEMNINITDSRYRLNVANINTKIAEIRGMINAIVNYRLLLEDEKGNPISKLMTLNTEQEVAEVTTEEENPLEKILTLPKLLINNYTYIQSSEENNTEIPSFVDTDNLVRPLNRKAKYGLSAINENKINSNITNITLTVK